MTQVTKVVEKKPEVASDESEVVQFRVAFDSRSVLDEIVRAEAQKMLQAAIEAEVDHFLETHADRCDAAGRRQVVRNGHLPARELITGAGRIEVSQPRVRDRSEDKEGRVRFSSSILPPYLRRTKSMEELIPWLYLKGISTGDFNVSFRQAEILSRVVAYLCSDKVNPSRNHNISVSGTNPDVLAVSRWRWAIEGRRFRRPCGIVGRWAWSP